VKTSTPDRIALVASVALIAALWMQVALAAEPPASSPAAGAPAPVKSGAKDEPAPAEMVLCRSPRGAVFARDAKVGCKFGARLGPSNLVDFGATGGGSDCSLHSARGSTATSCDALCRAASPDSSCVIGIGQGADGTWASLARETSVAELAAAGGHVVCCRSRAPDAK
jgi:hypothetical protein